MAKGFNEELSKEGRRIFRNFTRKVRYNKTKTKGRGMLPKIQTFREFRKKYYDKPRSEIKKQLSLYESFGSRDALNRTGSSRLSKWERNYFRANREKVYKFYTDEINDLERIIGGHPEYHLRIHERLQSLYDKRKELDRNLSELTEDQIKGLRRTYEYAERSDLIKAQGFRTYLNQLELTMDALGYSDQEINALLDKFNVLSENEFTEMVRNEDIIDGVYTLINSPKGRGVYELTTDEVLARNIIHEITGRVDELVAKYKTSK